MDFEARRDLISGSSQSLEMQEAAAAGEPGAKRRPSPPSRRISLKGGISDRITGSPLAIASVSTLPNVSVRLAWM